MRLGLHAIGTGSGARRGVIDAVARAAEVHGFATLWAGEHVVTVDDAGSRDPYSAGGTIAVPAAAEWLDPLVALSFAAAATASITLATGVLQLPEHNAVLLAKQAASLDVLSGGRLSLGIGVGWAPEEFAALGIPFARRGARAAECLHAMRVLWRDDVASFDGEFVSFSDVRVDPKPIRDRRIPIIVGGNSDAALARVARMGDGWYGFRLTGRDAVRERLAVLDAACADVGRHVRDLHIAVALEQASPADVAWLSELGVDELVLVEVPPGDPAASDPWLAALARRWARAAH